MIPRGRRVLSRTAWRRLTRRDDVKLKGFRFHDTRHTFRSDLADNNVDEETAIVLMGHRSQEGLKVYRHERKEYRDGREQAKKDAVCAMVKKKWQRATIRNPDSGLL